MITTQIQVCYKAKSELEPQETELYRFSVKESADKFLASIVKNPDVQWAKKL